MQRLLLALVMTALVPGCSFEDLFADEPDGGSTTKATGTVSGTVSPFQGATSASATGSTVDPALRRVALAALNKAASPGRPGAVAPAHLLSSLVTARPTLGTSGRLYGAHRPSQIVPSQLIVRFVERVTADQALRALKAPDLTLTHLGFASPFLHLIGVEHSHGAPLNDGETRELVASFARRSGVRFVELNRVRHPLVVPNDNLYPAMWHLTAINMPAAWDLEKGTTAAITVAVVDTGIIQHPDLTPRVVGGYDFIRDAATANDGDGRDADPTDPGGDQPNGASSWHGTHCAGTIGAVTDNANGIAGINWNARIVPVRVLGKGGGTDFDIAAGMAWASGQTVPGLPANPNVAQVISLSLGGVGDATRTYQDVIDAAGNVIFVVAAGNDNVDAATFSPCNQTGVLCIGATRFNGTRASYSNFGQRVDVMAPGGETGEDSNGDGYPDGVLSTLKDDSNGKPTFAFEQGTSMAAPHVAGIVSLMKARAPGLTFAQVRQILTETANPASRCTEGCGAGLVNVHAALLRAGGTQATGPARLSLSATDLFFTTRNLTQNLTLTNLGGQTLTVTLTPAGARASLVSVTGGASRTIAAGQSTTVQLVGSLAGVADGTTEAAAVNLTSNGGNAVVNIRLRAGAVGGKNVAVGLVFQKGPSMEWAVAAETEAKAISGFTYSLAAEAGSYFVFGAQDSNGDGQFQEEEPFGFWPNSDSPKQVTVVAGKSLSNTNFGVSPQTSLPGAEPRVIGNACTTDATCGENGVCGTGFPQGYCTQDCRTDACPLSSKCLTTDSVAFCLATCTGPRMGRSTCRSGYVCENDGAGTGLCVPACTSSSDCEGAQTCTVATGYCE